MLPSQSVIEIHRRIVADEVEKARHKALELGMPEGHFSADLARKQIEDRDSAMVAAIVEYLDECFRKAEAHK